jgi:hypothetical protein
MVKLDLWATSAPLSSTNSTNRTKRIAFKTSPLAGFYFSNQHPYPQSGLFFALMLTNMLTMKKVSFLFSALMLSTIVFAQSPSFGLKGGINISRLPNTPQQNFNSRLGFHVGGLAHIHLSRQFALQPEVVYSSQGAKYTLPGSPEHSLALNYINIPLQLQYMFDNGFRLQTGPQAGFLVGVSDKVNGQETNFFDSEDFKDLDFAWSFGLGYLSHSGFGIDGRYNLGLTNINEDRSYTLRNNVIQIGLFYLFDNSHKRKSR